MLLSFVVALGCSSTTTKHPGAQSSASLPTTLRVFSIGHSLSSELPDMVASLASNTKLGPGAALKYVFQEQFRLGASLQTQFNDYSKGEGAKWDDGNFRTTYVSALPKGNFDAVILVDSVPRGGPEQQRNSIEYLTKFVRYIQQTNPRARILYSEPWHSLKSGTGKAEWDNHSPTRNLPWRKRVDADASMWREIKNAAERATGAKIILVPQAQGLAALADAIERGECPGWSRIEDLFSDDIHVNLYGTYFNACLQYGVLFGRSPVGLTIDVKNRWTSEYWGKKHYFPKAYDRPSPKAVAVIQRIAWEFAQKTN